MQLILTPSPVHYHYYHVVLTIVICHSHMYQIGRFVQGGPDTAK